VIANWHKKNVTSEQPRSQGFSLEGEKGKDLGTRLTSEPIFLFLGRSLLLASDQNFNGESTDCNFLDGVYSVLADNWQIAKFLQTTEKKQFVKS